MNSAVVRPRTGSASSRHGQVEQQPSVARQQIALPGTEDDRVAAAHQIAVAGVGERAWPVGVRGVAEVLDGPLVAPVAPVEEQPSAPAVDRTQDLDVPAEAHLAGDVGRHEVEVGDCAVGGRLRVHGVVGGGGEHFVRPDAGEAVGLGERLAGVHLQPDWALRTRTHRLAS
ncbi:hypothetical protein ACIG63_39840 [Streptomyces antimycoticus]|uniref:hypothetical protein n=1 Tax=Streptomyces antimycoticus TaxID=68175 RepID=UPI0037D52D2C